MQIQDLLARIYKRWLVILIVVVVAVTLTWFYGKKNQNLTSTTVYKASISVGINNLADLNQPQTVSYVPPRTITIFTSYLQNRFASPEVQYKIATILGLEIVDFNQTTPFYGIIPQDGGFVTLVYQNGDQNLANKFILAVKQVYNELIIIERSENLPNSAKVYPQTSFVEAVFPVTKNLQQSSYIYLPAIGAFLLTLVALLLLPLKNNK
jgi:hypothetical protein